MDCPRKGGIWHHPAQILAFTMSSARRHRLVPHRRQAHLWARELAEEP